VSTQLTRSSTIYWFGSIFLSVAFLIAFALQMIAPKIIIPVTLENIGHLRGNAYAFVIPKPFGWPIFQTRGDTYDAQYSSLIVFEDGKPLPRPHDSISAIESIGEGRFLHLRETELYFSTSDNTDPRANGRKYLISIAATPLPGLVDTLLVATIVAWAFSLLIFEIDGFIRFRYWTIIAVGSFAVIAIFWQILIIGPIPRIVMSADAGLVSSIAAADLYPTKFATDYVFSDRGNFAFYWTLLIPLVVGAGHIIGDIGTAWGLLAGPLLFLQMLGFFLLGRRLFGETGWSIALALISVPPVFVFGGELWGNLAEPLTRSTFNALFPYIVLLSLPPAQTWRKFAAMALCGLGVYLHPVSAPGVAMAVWFALLFFRPEKESWVHHCITSVAAGFVFVAIAIPFAVSFTHSFPINPNSEAAVLSRTLLQTGAGPQYQHAEVALQMFFSGGVNNPHAGWNWRWIIWAAALVAFIILPKRADVQTAARLRFLGALSIGIVLASVGVSIADQTVARILQRNPLQLDLIRNLRFIIPVLLIGAVACLAWFAKLPARSKIVPASMMAVCVFVVLQWWVVYPTPISAAAFGVLDGRLNDNKMASGQRIIHSLAAAASGSRVLILPTVPSDQSTELVGLAVRYAALKPVVFLSKDLNFLSYSSSPKLIEWKKKKEELTALAQIPPSEATTRLAQVIADNTVTFILAQTNELSPALVTTIDGQAKPIARDGTWQLWRVPSY
jgi:hypothetical protein